MSGSVWRRGRFVTSYIPVIAAAVTRATDQVVISAANMVPWFASPGGSWMAEFIYSNPPDPNRRVIHATGASGSVSPMQLYNAAAFLQYDGASGVLTANTGVVGAVTKCASNWAPGTAKICLNVGAVAGSAALTNGYGFLATSGISLLASTILATETMTGTLRRVSYWPRALSDAEMQSVTT